jgi:outer membrane receptor protein involved in Fe transport
MTRRTTYAFAVATALLLGGVADAQDVALPEPVAAPTTGNKEGEPEIALDADREIDLANVVTSAAKGVTTVQEAPAIITIMTADEIKSRGFRFIEDALATIPGWLNTAALGQQVTENPMVRGTGQAALMLRDGVSMFDPWSNATAYQHAVPLESIKRIEVVTGPGGVLWGANSYLGIINVIMKDAEDVNGLEVSAGYGDGPGLKQDMRAYAMFGKTFFGGKLKIFQHLSYENWIGPVWNTPNLEASSPAPQPTGPAFFGPLSGGDPARSWMVIADGKYSLGPVSLYYHLPFAKQHQQIEFAATPSLNNGTTFIDRHVALEYKDRFAKDKIGLALKGYWSQFVDAFDAQLYPTSSFFPAFTGPNGPNAGGIHFFFNPDPQTLIQRSGLTADLDFNLKYGFKVLVGGEFFYESMTGSTEFFTSAPYSDPSLATATMGGTPMPTPASLPLLCPQRQMGSQFLPVALCPKPYIKDVYRLVGALYADLQYHPFAKLTLDGGVRLQDGFGGRPYALTPLYSGAIVWNFLPDYHVKLNYSTGFRPPTFNVTDGYTGGIQYGSNPNLRNETSQSFQGELNARLLRNTRKIRELELRLDYSYTVLNNLIQIRGGTYDNTGQRAMHSVEALGKLYLNGDHYLTASYTFLYAATSDTGLLRTMPNHWVSLGATFNIIKNTFDLNANLLVIGAYEDPNRVPSSPNNIPGTTTVGRTTDLAFDRLTPVALLQLGFRLRFLKEKLGITGQFYNVLNQRYWYADPFYDVTPSVELNPNPAPGFSFMASASYHF